MVPFLVCAHACTTISRTHTPNVPFSQDHVHTFINKDGDVRGLDFRFFLGDTKIGAPFHGACLAAVLFFFCSCVVLLQVFVI